MKYCIPIFSLSLFFSHQCYSSQDCGYVFTKGPAAWAALPDNYGCPPCGAPKRRFTKVPKGGANKKAVKVTTSPQKDDPTKKKSWF